MSHGTWHLAPGWGLGPGFIQGYIIQVSKWPTAAVTNWVIRAVPRTQVSWFSSQWNIQWAVSGAVTAILSEEIISQEG